jgi:energy-converting hydrogenase Eha subunit E
MAKCCCQSSIDASKNQILAALGKPSPIIPQAVPPFQRTQNDTEEIARRVSDEVNRNVDPFQRDVQRQLDAIVNSLIALRSDQKNNDLLNRILRNQNDDFDLARENHRRIQFGLDKLATRDQAKDLLRAIASLRSDVLEQFKFLAREVAVRFAAIGGAIIALGVAQKAAFLAEISAKTAQTAVILRAIAALKLSSQKPPDLSDLISQIEDLLSDQLSLEPVTGSVPVCVTVPGGGSIIQAQPFQGYALRNKAGNSTAAYQTAMNELLYQLVSSGRLECSSSGDLESEVILEVDKDEEGATQPKLCYPFEVSPLYYVIQCAEIEPDFVRTYKLAGSQSEYGIGNWAFVDASGRLMGDFHRLFVRSHRINVPEGGTLPGLRISLKPGISAIVTAYGLS